MNLTFSKSCLRESGDWYQIESCRVMPVRWESMSRSVTVEFRKSL